MKREKDFIIRRGELKKCLSKEKQIAVPECVTDIETDAFMGLRHVLE